MTTEIHPQDTIENATEKAAVRRTAFELKPMLENTDMGYALARDVLGPKVTELDVSHDKGAVSKLERGLPTEQAVITAVRDANRRYKDAAGNHEIAESAAATAREVAANHRLELGRALADARRLFPRSGPKAKGWYELLESEGIPRQTALDYMKFAGHLEEVPTPRRGNPSYRKLGIKKDKKAPSLADHLTSVLADLETRLIDATKNEREALVTALEKWLEARR